MKRLIKSSLTVVLVLSLSFLLWRIVMVNREWPQPKEIIIPKGEAYVLNGDSYAILDVSFFNSIEALCEKFPHLIGNEEIDPYYSTEKILLVSIKSDSGFLPCVCIEKGAYWRIYNQPFFYLLNEVSPSGTYLVPFVIPETGFPKNDWVSLDANYFKTMTFTTYPERVLLSL